MDRVKKLTAIIMAMLFCLCSLGNAFAEPVPGESEGQEEPRLSYITDKSHGFSSPAAGKLSFWAECETDDIMMKLGLKELKIQRWTGLEWVDEVTLTKQYSTFTDYYYYSNTWPGMQTGYIYRATFKLYAMRGVLLTQTISLTSSEVICS